MQFGGLLAIGMKLSGEKPISNMQAFNTLILKTEIVLYFLCVNAYLNINVKGTSKFVLSTANAFKVNSAYQSYEGKRKLMILKHSDLRSQTR